MDFLFLDSYLVLSESQVDFRKHLGHSHLVERVVNSRKWALLVDYHLVQMPIVNAQSQGSIFISDKQH